MSEAYLYGINPRRPIKNLNDEVKIIRTNTSLFLTKEEVAKCLPFASVWRRFAADNLVKVTSDAIDRLHNDKFYTEEEWEQMKKDELGENRGKVTKPVEDEKVTIPETVAEEQPAGETVQEESEPETIIEEAPSEVEEPETEVPVETEDNSILENNDADIPQHEAEETSEDSSDANSGEGDSETGADESSNIDINSYNGKKKKHKH